MFGVIPAMKYRRPRIAETLRGGGRSSSDSRERHRARDVLVVAQVSLALVLLIGSGLMIRTFQALRAVEPGFTHPEQLQTMRISIPVGLMRDAEARHADAECDSRTTDSDTWRQRRGVCDDDAR